MPIIDTTLLTNEERPIITHINVGLYHLHSLCEDLSAALALLEFSRANSIINETTPESLSKSELFTRWKFIAARDGVGTVYKFGETMGSLGKNINSMPTVRKLLDHKLKKAAIKAYNDFFPDIANVRHSTQHGNMHNTPEKWKRNAGSNPGTIINSMMSDTLITTMDGRPINFTLNKQSFDKLVHVKLIYFSAFHPLKPQWAQ